MPKRHPKLNPLQVADGGYSLATLFSAEDMDCDSIILWRAHLSVLRRLALAGQRGLPLCSMQDTYCELSAMYPELYEGCSPADWMSALEKAEVLSRTNEAVWITEKGLFLISFVECEAVLGCDSEFAASL